MSSYVIASRCGANGWVVSVDGNPPSGCTPIPQSGDRYCCPESVARGLPGGRLLDTLTAEEDTQEADDTVAEGTPWIDVAWDRFIQLATTAGASSEKVSEVVDQVNKGVDDAVGQVQQRQQTAPRISTGMIVVGGVLAVGAAVATYAILRRGS